MQTLKLFIRPHCSTFYSFMCAAWIQWWEQNGWISSNGIVLQGLHNSNEWSHKKLTKKKQIYSGVRSKREWRNILVILSVWINHCLEKAIYTEYTRIWIDNKDQNHLIQISFITNFEKYRSLIDDRYWPCSCTNYLSCTCYQPADS